MITTRDLIPGLVRHMLNPDTDMMSLARRISMELYPPKVCCMPMPGNPLAEIFGFPADNNTNDARRCRQNKLCPFNNRVPSCTKDKAQDPLGVCTIANRDHHAITCPVRFRENWLIAEDAAKFFFPEGTSYTSLTEIRLNDANGESAGNIDVVLVSYDADGTITDFGAVEVQGVYISGNVRNPFREYMKPANIGRPFTWSGPQYPRADYLSSSRKRLIPQLIFKGGILNSWGKKTAVVIDEGFFESLPVLPIVDKAEADLAWLVYDLEPHPSENRLTLTMKETVYTKFKDAMDIISVPKPGRMEEFVNKLQEKLDEKLETPPETHTIECFQDTPRE